MKYLVTGGAGFIGSSLIDRLLKKDNDVVCIDSFDDFYDKNIKLKNIENAKSYNSFRLLQGDIRDNLFVEKCFRENEFDLVFHLAARAGVRPSILNPKIYYDNNVLGTLNILETMHKYSIKKMIFSSSSSVYGNNKEVPFSETDNVDYPISPYAATKKACELLCYNYHHLYDIEINCLRLFTVYGPRQRPDLAIHKFTELIMRDKEIPIYGDGTMKRDYTFIEDTVNGILNASNLLNGYNIFNLGNSTPISLNNLIQVLEKVIGKKALLNYLPQSPGDVDITYADISKAKKYLNYNPSTDIETGIIKFVKWIKR